MRAVKAVKQNYTPTPAILELLETFRCMVNDCVQIGIAEHLTSMKSLSLKAYHSLDNYAVYTQYRLTAISKGAGMLRNYRRVLKKNRNARPPYATKLMLTDCYGFRIENGQLRLPIRANQYIHISLNQHTLAALAGSDVRSVTLTARNFSISFSKETAEIEPHGLIGIDRNLNNVTTVDSNGRTHQYDLSEATRIKSRYREVKRHFKRNDVRICRGIYGKYGQKQRNKVQQILHHASKMIVQQANQNQHGIVMEKLTGIRKLYRKGNGQGRWYHGRMNSWSYAELQRQIDYKAHWEGLPVIYVEPWGTSSKCSICGSHMMRIPEENRMLRCPSCGYTVDRDVNAARNLVARGLRFSPVVHPTEAMVSVYTPPVDGWKPN